jgi:hypothetical protein
MFFIQDTSEIQKFIGINADFNFDILKPHLNWAQESYLPDLLGALYDKLVYVSNYGYSQQDLTQKPVFDVLFDKVNSVIVHIAVFDWLSIAGISLSDIGLHRLESEMGGTTRKSAYQYQELSAKEFYRKRGFNAMDNVLKYVIQNITIFTEFLTSESYKNLTTDIIPNTTIFNKHYNIGGSMLLFMKLKPFIHDAEVFDIIPAIGNTLFENTKANVNATQGSYATLIIPAMRRALANLAIARGIEACSINLVEDGARLIVRDSFNSNIETISKPDLSKLIAVCRNTGENYLGLLCSNIRANINQFPSFIDSRTAPLDNTDKKLLTFY